MRSLPALLLCVAFACSSDNPAATPDAMGGCPADWWDCDFSSRRSIEVAPSGGALSNFPLLVQLSEDDLVGIQDQGDDLRFVNSQGAVLPYEIDNWRTGTAAQIWVRVPDLEADSPTTLTMYWGNESADAPTNGKEVWADGYQGVWHLNQPAAETAVDSTGNLNNGAPIGASPTTQVAGAIGNAIDFEGKESWIEVPHSPTLDITGSAITISAWAYIPQSQSSDGGLVVKTDDTDYHYQIGIQNSQQANVRVLTNTQTYLTGLSPLESARWYYIVGVYDGSKSTIYVNAHKDNVYSQSGPIATVAAPLLIGRRALNDDRFFDGRIDEARVSDVARSEAWITAEFQNVTGELVSLGAVEGF